LSLENLLANRKVLTAALRDVGEAADAMKAFGMDDTAVRQDAVRILSRLTELQMEIEKIADDN
jgi:hypothetical protein